ncbi:hypothetical protein ACJMK2_023663 [Sinanodonta woodiana]|uniref:Polypeptide N-acetylgalactosaminyltransferase n=1 Tax=Sinanodonta woodiana TaxID=1069815 RepID=A0ABD3T5I7_SINWO
MREKLSMMRWKSFLCFKGLPLIVGVFLVGTVYVINVYVIHNSLQLSSEIISSHPRLISGRKHDPLYLDQDFKYGKRDSHQYNDIRDPDGLDKFYDTFKLQLLGIIKTPEDQRIRDEGYREHAFNELISSRLSFHRKLPDSRHKLCESVTYQSDLPQASVIICFYNEAWSALLRTVHSVIDKTPPHLLYEIVLVDDYSQSEQLHENIAEYIWNILPHKIKLVRTPRRLGLIRARMYGARIATAEVLVFLDSHCEVNVKWLEPLLARAAENRRNVAIPVIDIINSDSFEYEASPLVKGGFNWGLHFRWDHLSSGYFSEKEAMILPIETPTMAGGLFAINRQYFFEMGQYDSGMDIWGGENLEISFRIWQCRGRLDIIPCSRVGHVFRKRRPYGSPNGEDTMTKNSLRLAHVWMDDYIKYYFQLKPQARSINYGNITDRLELRKKLNCNSFEWYLKYIYPEQTLPDMDNKTQKSLKKPRKSQPARHKAVYINTGWLKHKSSGLCVQTEGDIYVKKSLLVLARCIPNNQTQEWSETEEHEFQLSKLLCLDIESSAVSNSYARLMKCHGSGGSQSWIWKSQNLVSQLYNPGSGKCLVPFQDAGTTYLTIDICTDNPEMSFKLQSNDKTPHDQMTV